jgi:hypothetical protein
VKGAYYSNETRTSLMHSKDLLMPHKTLFVRHLVAVSKHDVLRKLENTHQRAINEPTKSTMRNTPGPPKEQLPA